MKSSIFLIIIALLISGCSSPSGSSSSDQTASTPPAITTPGITEPTEPGEPTEPEGPGITTPEADATDDTTLINIPSLSGVKMSMIADSNLYFYTDDLEYETSGTIQRSDIGTYAIDNQLVTYDASGDPIEIVDLPVIPTKIKTVGESTFYCYEYDAATSQSLGALPKIHSEIYQDLAIISAWYNNQWSCADIVAASDSVYVIDSVGSYHKFTGSIDNPIYIENNQFVVHDWDSVAKTIWFNDRIEHYLTNNILAAKQWQAYQGLYYSENGYTWSEDQGLEENATALQAFQAYPYPVSDADMPYGQHPVMLKLGVYMDKLLWVECNTGWLFSYDPINDKLVQKYRMYLGDGLHATGIDHRDNLKPTLTDGILYYRDAGVIMQLSVDTGLIDIFYAGDGETMEF